MNTWRKLAALFGAALLTFALFGIVLAGEGPTDPVGISPTTHEGNITEGGGGQSDAADCDEDDAITFSFNPNDPENDDFSGDPLEASGTTENGVTVTAWYDEEDKELSFESEDGIVTIVYVKGGNEYNEYDYTGEPGGGVTADGHLHAPENASGGAAGLSHVVFCTGEESEVEPTPTFEASEAAETDEPSFEASQEAETETPTEPPTNTIGGGTSGPADGAWLLVVALGVFLASVVVLTPARAKSR